MASQKRQNYLSKDEFAMELAILAAQRSKDPRTQVGAVILDNQRRVLGYGYNGHPSVNSGDINNDEEFSWDANDKHKFVCHAERNAIDFKTGDIRDAVMFVTLYPCNECAKTIVQSKIRKVIYLNEKDSKNIKLADSKRILEGGLAEKPVKYFDYLKAKVGDEKAMESMEKLNKLAECFK